VNDHRVEAHVFHQDHIERESILERLLGHRLPAVLDHQRFAGECPDVRQRFHEDIGFLDQPIHAVTPGE